MSEQTPDQAPDRPAERPSRTVPTRRGGSLALAVLLALLALAVAAWVAWQQWQGSRAEAARGQAVQALDTRLGRLESTVSGLADERTLLRQRLSDAEQVNRALREELLGQADRLRDVEAAVAKLSEKSLSGRDGALLDETEALLRLGQQRYALFHDAQGAAEAYAQAERSIAAVDDAALSDLRQSIAAEREALQKAAGQGHAAMVTALQQLRGQVPQWPLKPLDRPTAQAPGGFWARIGRALATVVSVQRDTGAPLAVADGRLTRELVALDLAQAQADLLAHDTAAARSAIQRADAGLAAQFDLDDAAVGQARERLAAMAAALRRSDSVELGAALAELRNLRAVHALNATPAPAASAPARSSGKGTGP